MKDNIPSNELLYILWKQLSPFMLNDNDDGNNVCLARKQERRLTLLQNSVQILRDGSKAAKTTLIHMRISSPLKEVFNYVK